MCCLSNLGHESEVSLTFGDPEWYSVNGNESVIVVLTNEHSWWSSVCGVILSELWSCASHDFLSQLGIVERNKSIDELVDVSDLQLCDNRVSVCCQIVGLLLYHLLFWSSNQSKPRSEFVSNLLWNVVLLLSAYNSHHVVDYFCVINGSIKSSCSGHVAGWKLNLDVFEHHWDVIRKGKSNNVSQILRELGIDIRCIVSSDDLSNGDWTCFISS